MNGVGAERVSWNCKIKHDMSMCGGTRFLFYCEDPGAADWFTFYFHSGGGFVYDLKIYCHFGVCLWQTIWGAVYLRLY